ncbi:MAG TPA: DNA polymerase III subunit gamma/tau [Candidatus Sulfotelmatobacter sp.]|nr:DNA polymerase III subunit gamma/tau [Candidatus Sulfotelmatobacter sp.]
MTYKVIARKYRPRSFAEVVGQQHVTQTLANAIRTNRVAHAYIFSGVRGVGKTTTARILAKALNCVKGPTPEPDNTCDSCREISASTSLDVLEIDAASNRGIDQIRELREMVRYAPASSRYKVVILDEAHQLTDEASNALLKTLEEPPERVIFILATTRQEDLVETIKSRAQLFQFRSLSFKEIASEIERIAKAENLKIEPGAVAVLARAAQGSLRDGLSLLEQAIAYSGDEINDAQVRELLGVVAERVLDELVEAIASQSGERVLTLVHRLIGDGQNLQHFCREAIRHFRNLLVARVCGADSDLVAAPQDERPRLAEQAARFSEEDLTRFFQILVSTDNDLRHVPDPRLHLELGLLKLVNAQRLAPLEEILADLRNETGGAARSTRSAASPEPAPRAAAAGQTVSASAGPAGAATAARMAPAPSSTSSPAKTAPPAAPPVRNAVPIPASPPRIVARAAEDASSGLGSAQLDAIKAALQGSKLLSSFLEHATRCEIEGSELRLFFAAENRAIADMLPREAMERLRTVTHQVLGQAVRVCVKLESGGAALARSAELRARFEEDPIVRAMLERFGGQISKVKRPGEE